MMMELIATESAGTILRMLKEAADDPDADHEVQPTHTLHHSLTSHFPRMFLNGRLLVVGCSAPACRPATAASGGRSFGNPVWTPPEIQNPVSRPASANAPSTRPPGPTIRPTRACGPASPRPGQTSLTRSSGGTSACTRPLRERWKPCGCCCQFSMEEC